MTSPRSKKVARELLGTFSQDELPAESKERAFAAFGIVAGVTGVSTIATGGVSGAAVTAAAPAAVAAKTVATIGALSVIKAGLVGVVLGVVAVQASVHVTADSRREASSSDPAAVHGAEKAIFPSRTRGGHDRETAVPAVPVASPASPIEPPLEIDSARRAPTPVAPRSAIAAMSAPVPARARHVASNGERNVGPAGSTDNGPALPSAADEKPVELPAAPARAAPRATLTDEIARLDRSRAALRQGAPGRALWELDGYDREFTSGSLRQEATVLRIEVLVEMGETARAQALAAAFDEAHPTSGYLGKIRELLTRVPKRGTP